MARSRNIKHGLWLNEILAELSIYARYIFPCIWCLADKEGRLEYRPKKIKAEAYPYDNIEIPPLLIELHEKEFITVYAHNGRAYIQVNNWKKHQNPHPKEKPSDLPNIEDKHSTKATIGFINGNEKQFNFTESNGPAVKFNLIPDSNHSDSNHSSSNASRIEPVLDIEPYRPQPLGMTMTMKEFSGLYYQTFGKMMSGMLNQKAHDICQRYPPDKIRSAFDISATRGASSFAYTEKVLQDGGPQTDEEYNAELARIIKEAGDARRSSLQSAQ